MQCRTTYHSIKLLAVLAMVAFAGASELQGSHTGSSSGSSRALVGSRRLLQLPARQQGGLLSGLTAAVMPQAAQMLGRGGQQPGNAAAARPAGNTAGGLTGLLSGAGGNTNTGANRGTGALGNLMTPQNMQALQGAAARMMGAGRRLQQWGSRATQRMANNMRASVATSQAIENAVNNGGSMASTRRAGATGSLMSWAAAQEDQDTFNAAERFARWG